MRKRFFFFRIAQMFPVRPKSESKEQKKSESKKSEKSKKSGKNPKNLKYPKEIRKIWRAICPKKTKRKIVSRTKTLKIRTSRSREIKTRRSRRTKRRANLKPEIRKRHKPEVRRNQGRISWIVQTMKKSTTTIRTNRTTLKATRRFKMPPKSLQRAKSLSKHRTTATTIQPPPKMWLRSDRLSHRRRLNEKVDWG